MVRADVSDNSARANLRPDFTGELQELARLVTHVAIAKEIHVVGRVDCHVDVERVGNLAQLLEVIQFDDGAAAYQLDFHRVQPQRVDILDAVADSASLA